MTAEAMPAGRAPHPVSFDVDYPRQLSRLTTCFRLILAIPQLFVVYLLMTAFSVLSVLAWFAILFTGRYPKAFFDFNSGVLRWTANVVAYAALLRDEYPPFSWEPGQYPVTLVIEPAERQSRWRLFVRGFAVIPNMIVLYFVELAWLVTSIVAWFAILFTGKYPRGLFSFAVGTIRWFMRERAYLYLLRDEYPPYSINSYARPGNEVVSAIIGFPLFVAYVTFYIAFSLLPFVGLLGNETDTVTVRSPLTSPALAAEAPTGEANGVRVTIIGYDDDAPVPSDASDFAGYRFVTFRLRAEKDGFFPMFFSPAFLRLHDCSDTGYSPESISPGFEFSVFWRAGEDEGTATFQIPVAQRVCDLVYHSGFGEVEFRFVGGP